LIPGLSVLRTLFLWVGLIGIGFAWEIPFGEGLGKLSSSDKNQESFDIGLPYSMLSEAGQLHVLDPIQKKIMVFDVLGVLLHEISLDLEELTPYHPIQAIQLSLGSRYFLLSRKNQGMILLDPANNHIKIFHSQDLVNQEILYPNDLKKYQGFYFVSDLLAQKALIYSRLGNLLGKISYPESLQIEAFSPNEVLCLTESRDRAQLELVSMSADKRVFYRPSFHEGDEFASLRIIGLDVLGNVYLERISGKKHGHAKHFVLKVNPLGQLQKEARVEVTPADSFELGFRFVLMAEDKLFQLHFNKSALSVKGILLK